MKETNMPAAEVEAVDDAMDRYSYELAFHVLPTVAEGEVSKVFDDVKAIVANNGGELFDEEAPERFELAYEIVRNIEGKNRKYNSAYFGWVRFRSESGSVEALMEEIDERSDILRHLLVRLTRAEEEHAFRFHEALDNQKMVSDVDEVEVAVDSKEVASTDESGDNEEDKSETVAEVDEKEIDEALKKDEA